MPCCTSVPGPKGFIRACQAQEVKQVIRWLSMQVIPVLEGHQLNITHPIPTPV